MNKRYQSYKPTAVKWIGEIPKHWDCKPLKYLLKAGRDGIRIGPFGSALKSDIIKKEGYKVYGQENVIGDDFTLGHRYIDQNKFEELRDYEIFSGDVLITMMGTTGQSKVVPPDIEKGIMDSHLIRMRFDEEKVSPTLMAFLINEAYYIFNHVKYLSKGSIMDGLNSSTVKSFPIVLPPREEQILIENFINRIVNEINDASEKKKRLIDLLHEEKAALINHAVTKGIDAGAPMKPSGVEWLGEVPAHWEVKRLKHVADINPTTKSYQFERNSDDDVVFLPMEKVTEEGLIDCELRKPISALSTGYTYFERNDVIVAKITPCFENGKGAFLDRLEGEFGFGSTEFHVLRASDRLLPEFLYYVTKCDVFMQMGEANMTGAAGQKRVPTSFISDFNVGVPDKPEQQLIVEYIKTQCNRIEATTSKITKEIELLDEYKQSLIFEVVTGKVNVYAQAEESIESAKEFAFHSA